MSKPEFLFDTKHDLDPVASGIEVTELPARELTAAEHLIAMNGRLRMDVPCVRGEHWVFMNGTVPEDWGLL